MPNTLLPEKFNLAQYCLEKNARQYPNKLALIIVNDVGKQQTFTYQECYQTVRQLAAGLKNLGYARGTRLVIRAKKSFDFILLFFAAVAAGLVPIATLPELTAAEVLHIIHDSAATLYYQSDEVKLNLDLPTACQRLTTEQLQKLMGCSALEFTFDTAPQDPALIIYTSGSTNKPKGVVHAQRMILGREPIRHCWLNLQANDVVLVSGQLCWIYPLGVGLLDTWAASATALMYTGPVTPAIWYRLIEHYQVTLFASNPSNYLQMMSVADPLQFNLSSLKRVVSAGFTLSDKVSHFWQQYLKIPIFDALGLTEISTFISSGPMVPPRAGYVGKPQLGRKIAILPLEHGTEPLPPHQQGVLAIDKDDPGLMLGYLNHPVHTRGCWFLTDDLVSMDTDGYIQHHGRKDEVLVVPTGERVSPREVEEIMLQSPWVLDAACTLVKNVLTAFVVLRDKNKENDITQKMLLDFASTQLAPYKTPKEIVFIEQIPRNMTGKIARTKLLGLIAR